MKTLLNIIIFTVLLCTVGCKKLLDNPRFLEFENNSRTVVMVTFQYTFPDTTIQDRERIDYVDTLGANRSMKIPTASSVRRWADHISEMNSNSTIMVYVFSQDTIDNYQWEEIQENYNILKRYDLTIEELESQNWKITYP